MRPDGSPHVVPFVFVIVGSGSDLRVYWAVDAKRKRGRALQRIENIRAHPAVELVVDGYDEDWTELWWVRLTGRARVLASGDERGAALAGLADKYPQYRAVPPEGPVIAIDVDRVTGWSAGDSPTP